MNRLLWLFLVLLGITLPFTAYAQTKPRLAVLPLTGDNTGDAETIAELFSFEPVISQNFEILSRTRIVNAINAEQRFQRDGLTDTNTVQELGKRLNAEYVLSGSITSLATRKLLLISIIHVERLQQIAGAYREYNEIEEVDRYLPDMAKEITAAARKDTSSLRKLSVIPIEDVPGNVDRHDAEVLTQILTMEIVKSGKFAVFPRTSSLKQVMEEHSNQRDGNTDVSTAKTIGIGENPEYVLSVKVGNIGAKNMFMAAILHVVDGSQGENGRVDYNTIADGIKLMKELAVKLTITDEERTAQAEAQRASQRQANKRRILYKAQKWITENISDYRKFWSIGASGGIKPMKTPSFLADVYGTISVTPYTFLEIGTEISTHASGIKDVAYFSFFPYGHYNVGFIYDWGVPFYTGVGAGYMMSTYIFTALDNTTAHVGIPVLDIPMGFKIGKKNMFKFAYTIQIRVDGTAIVNHKLTLGYTHRFYEE
ncbi:hypothetical protein FACS1894137_02370 [Spirochaetia bacterium]|nr:hypothetical protein FACS1894137_02370 [Spirochaetia bacterium]